MRQTNSGRLVLTAFSLRKAVLHRYRHMRKLVALVVMSALFVSGCNYPTSPSSVSGSGVSPLAAGDQTPPAISRVDFSFGGDDGVRAVTTTDDNVVHVVSANSGPESFSIVSPDAPCLGDECPSDISQPRIIPALAAAALLALSLKAAWDFWQVCVTPARQEARRGPVSWYTVQRCAEEGSFIVAGGAVGRYLEGRGVRGVRNLIRNTLNGAVPQDVLLRAFNTRNFGTSVQVVSEIASQIVERIYRALYDLVRRH